MITVGEKKGDLVGKDDKVLHEVVDYVARSGNRFKLNDGLRENLWLTGDPTCASLFPLFTSESTSDVVIENITLDGNGKNNDISDSGKVGILFRDDSRGRDFWANRNLVEKNRISSSGGRDGVAIDIAGQTKEVRIMGNEIREIREPMNRTGIRMSPKVGTISMADNTKGGSLNLF